MAGWDDDRAGLLLPATAGTRGPVLTAKICLLGDPAVGKSSLVQRMAGRRFSEMYVTTVGASVLKPETFHRLQAVDCRGCKRAASSPARRACVPPALAGGAASRSLTKTVTVRPPGAVADVRLALMIWEINGHLPPSVVQPFLYGTDAAIVVADAARLDTQIDLWKWIEAARCHRGGIPVTVLVNKEDILEPGFDQELVEELSGEYRCTCRMASARTGRNVDRVLHEVAARLAAQNGLCG